MTVMALDSAAARATSDARPCVLLVDDDAHVLSALRRTLRGEGYDLLTASDGPTAIRLLQQHDVCVLVCDQRMPGMSGVEVLAESVKLRPHAARMTLTGQTDLKSAQDSVNLGRISQFLMKPWDDAHLRTVIREAVGRFGLERQVRELHALTCQQRDELERWNAELEDKVRARTAQLEAAYDETLDALVLALDTREHATAGHSRRVTVYCLYLAQRCGIPATDLENVYRGAMLHDIGKIGVPDAVLLKPGKLDPAERRAIEQHVAMGARVLERVGHLRGALEIPRYHHERFDGRGYLEGRRGPAIPIAARIFSVVDVYDALRSARPYKRPLAHDEALELIAAEGGRQFDPAVIARFREVPGWVWDRLATGADDVDCFADGLELCARVS
ncbi:MAG: putative cyclic di-GMP phosphodiesterase [Phycisphaerae bacterium]|nr:putative cyclic di-GMP phosphodiesterase [Phycisphaerae bacterium]